MTNQHLATATQLAPVIERVHGEHHPELTRVREITTQLHGGSQDRSASQLFEELRQVTQDYAIPAGTCEAFEATYQALERAGQQHPRA